MDHDTIIRLAREAGAEFAELPMTDAIVFNVEDRAWNSAALHRFASIIEAHLKEQGYRQCAKGQRTTQFCGMLEQAVLAEREECAKVCNDYDYPSECAAAIRSRT